LAGALKLELRPAVLETAMLPLTPCPYQKWLARMDLNHRVNSEENGFTARRNRRSATRQHEKEFQLSRNFGIGLGFVCPVTDLSPLFPLPFDSDFAWISEAGENRSRTVRFVCDLTWSNLSGYRAGPNTLTQT
jgi:hypothetical protein